MFGQLVVLLDKKRIFHILQREDGTIAGRRSPFLERNWSVRTEDAPGNRGRKPWIIVGSEKSEDELGLDRGTKRGVLFMPKSIDPEDLKKKVDQIAEWKAEEEAGNGRFRRLFARLLRRDA